MASSQQEQGSPWKRWTGYSEYVNGDRSSRIEVDGVQFGSFVSKTEFVPRGSIFSTKPVLTLDFSIRDIRIFVDNHYCIEFFTREVEEFVLVDKSVNANLIFLTLRYPPRLYEGVSAGQDLEFSSRCSSITISDAEGINRRAFAFSRTVRLEFQSRVKVDTVVGFFIAVGKTIYEATVSLYAPGFDATAQCGIPELLSPALRTDWEVCYAWLCVQSAHGFVAERFNESFWKELNYCTKSLAASVLYYVAKQLRSNLFVDSTEALKEGRRRGYSIKDVQDTQLHGRVPRIIITPFRILCFEPEVIQTNRVLREWGSSMAFLRVLVRDDGFIRLSSTKGSLEKILREIMDRLKADLILGSKRFQFLGSSNNQVRDHGCYFIDVSKNPAAVKQIRDWAGNLDAIKNVARYVARFGQVFSTSTNTITLDSKECERIPDIEQNGYCFTDGIGKITPDLAKEVAIEMGMNTVPCAFQIRFGGCKGVVAVDQNVHETNPGKKIFYRNSMLKYWSPHRTIEVLSSCARPQELYLNQQLIMLLSYHGVPDHVFMRLLNDALTRLSKMFIDEEVARAKLNGTKCGIDWGLFKESSVLITADPYLRSMLMALYRSQMKGLREKSRVMIDADDARVLIGTVDESRTLEYGQVFVQISKYIQNPGVEKIILRRRVVISKSPALHPGDLRAFDAVDCPALHHMCDCVVFPSKGKRPHPNELSGSDLDGDLYHVIWAEYLLPPMRIEEPMDYSAEKSSVTSQSVTSDDMLRFLRENIELNCLGQLDNTHKALADQLGIASQPCKKLARLHCQAVDAPKTGNWVSVPSAIRRMLDKYPDFMMKKDRPSYPTEKILGCMYRECTKFLNICSIHKTTFNVFEVAMSRGIGDMHDLEVFLPEARKLRRQFNGKVMELMSMYGIATEAEVMSGFVSNIHEKMGREIMDVTTTLGTLRDRLIKKYISLFLRDEKICHKGVVDENRAMQKAGAWYYVCYSPSEPVEEYRTEQTSTRFLSFAWVPSEYLLKLFKTRPSLISDSSAHTRIGRSIYEMLDRSMVRLLDAFQEQIEIKYKHGTFDPNRVRRLYREEMSRVLSTNASMVLHSFLYGMSYTLLFDERYQEVELLLWFSGLDGYLFNKEPMDVSLKKRKIHEAKSALQDCGIDSRLINAGRHVLIHFSFYSESCCRYVKGHAALDPLFWFQSALLLEYIFHYPWLLPLLRVVIKWAKAAAFVGLAKNTLTDSLSLCFMVVDYCIKHDAIPNVVNSEEVLQSLHEGKYDSYATCDVWKEIIDRLEENRGDDGPIGELLLGFFSDKELLEMKPFHISLQPALGCKYYCQTCSMECLRLLHDEMQRAFHKLAFHCSVEPLFQQVEIEKVLHLPATAAHWMIGSELFFARLFSKQTRTSVEVHQRGDKTGGLLIKIGGNNTGIHSVERLLQQFKERGQALDALLDNFPGVTELFVADSYRCIVEGIYAIDVKNVVLEDYWGSRHPEHDNQGLYCIRVIEPDEPLPRAMYDMQSEKFLNFKHFFLQRLALLRDAESYSPFIHGQAYLQICFGRLYLITPSKDIMEDPEGNSLQQLSQHLQKDNRYVITDLNRWKQEMQQYRPRVNGEDGWTLQHRASAPSAFYPKLNAAISRSSVESILIGEYGLTQIDSVHGNELYLRGKIHGVVAEYDSEGLWQKVTYPCIRWMLVDVKRSYSDRREMDIRFDLVSRAECHEQHIQSMVQNGLCWKDGYSGLQVSPHLIPITDCLREIHCRKYAFRDFPGSSFWDNTHVSYSDVHITSRPKQSPSIDLTSKERFLDLRFVVNLSQFKNQPPPDEFAGEVWYQAICLSDKLRKVATFSHGHIY